MEVEISYTNNREWKNACHTQEDLGWGEDGTRSCERSSS